MDLNKENVEKLLSDVYDPEINVDIHSLGLIYDIKISEENDLTITMTFTFPGCPYGPALIEEVKEVLKAIESIRNLNVEITFEPPWTPDMMNPDMRAALNL